MWKQQEQEEAKSEKEASKETEGKDTKEGSVSGELNIVHYLSEPQKIAALDELVAGFENEYPDIKVNQESTTLENYQDVLKLKFSTGDVPGYSFGEPKTYSVFVESGNVADLTDYDFVDRVQQNTLENVKIVEQGIWDSIRCYGKCGSYNKDIFGNCSWIFLKPIQNSWMYAQN